MAGLFLARNDDPAFAESALGAARTAFAAQGFPAPAAHALRGWSLLHFPYIVGGPEGLLVRGDDLVAAAGTPVVDGKFGHPALEALLMMDPLALDWDRIGGQFVALVRRGGRSFLFGDYFAAFQLFRDDRDRLFSTSFLAAAEALPRLSFDAQGVYELAFNVMPLGDDSVFAELKTLSPFEVVELTERGTIRHRVDKPLPAAPSDLPLAEQIAHHHAPLAAIVGAHVAQFGDQIRSPLSGGLDSRLVLAALREAGCRPELYVYGLPGDEDVEIAQAMGKALGFEVAWTDKYAETPPPDAFPELVERNFHQFDGLPTFGNIFDNGAHGAAQLARHAGGALAVSGGCGEIYRNFFYLPDRRFSAKDVARTFFARFVPGDATSAFDPRAFLDSIAEKIRTAIEPPAATSRLDRARIEQIYPRIRCRALFGREISLEGRYSPYLMPFLDHRVVAQAMTLPLARKHAGRFEAALLNAIDPQLAAQPSAYGHDFTGPPGRKHRFAEWSTRIRPIWLRQHTYAIRRRLGPMGDEHGGLLEPDYMNRVIDPAFPAMRRFFRIEHITDSGLWRRVANLEYLAAKLGSKLA
ncbi:asparagine synthase C-terminal domain-containing protein [Sphingomonas sp. BT-65]|uniref:asparagine synthase C-terminal domain-containing protein n=1 Tax=Sphingomonas sp. BT-65 TaxID=2989821 RepID=UPI0022367629|nr:asparagine synthase C-terminal domain-containing protein [Sphingomonas sp. BT-65]MCW4463188.1 asparagine synthase C-terminal domain-containing protein [Sphingomonas sp. BT-65]